MRYKYAILGALLLTLLRPFPLQAATREYVFAVLPQMPPVAMHTNWTPFLERLTRETGIRFSLKLYDRMNDFEQELKQGKADFVFANPPQAVLAWQSQGYVPLVRSSRKMVGVIVVRKDSPIKTLHDLDGKEISFVGSKNL